ncbi:cupredoxin domain-containing protein [Candidatus Woesearchaeota archaeon]|nr:cupredoxin domain-containing protein [Candidatus Woesearchaeota archaeon]
MRKKIGHKHLVLILALLVIMLILIFTFSVYEGSTEKGPSLEKKPDTEKKEEYSVQEIIEPHDVIPDESEEIPLIEENEKEIEILNEVTVTIRNLRFYPNEVTISPGTTIRWFNNDTTAHKVVAYDRLFYGPRLNPGEEYTFTFTKEGSHSYFDAVFPKIGRGKIVVKGEPLPITGGVIGIDLDKEETNGKFALLTILFIVMIFALSHGIHTHYKKI